MTSDMTIEDKVIPSLECSKETWSKLLAGIWSFLNVKDDDIIVIMAAANIPKI